MRKRLVLTSKKCIGCKSCELACSLANTGEMNPAKSRIATMSFIEGKYPLPYNFISTCRQCADAPCLTSCPVDAIKQGAEKIVCVDRERCIGCGMCVKACPFGAMLFDDEARKSYKCELCGGDRPACESICPTGAIAYRGKRPFYAKVADFEMQGCARLSKRNKDKLARKS